MKFAICNEIFQEWELEQQFAVAAELGYDAIEVAPFTIADDVRDITPAQRDGLRDLAARHGLQIAGIHWVLVGPEGLHITSPDEAVRARTRDYLCDLVQFGHDIGGQVMVVGSPKQRSYDMGVRRTEAWRWFAEAMAACASIPEAEGFTVCVEPLASSGTNLINRAVEARQMVSEIGLRNVRVILDVNSMWHEEESIPQAIRQTADLLAHFHANDPNQRGPGTGEVDFGPIMSALLAVNYQGYVSVEVFDFSIEPREHAAGSLTYLREELAAEGPNAEHPAPSGVKAQS